MPISNSDNEVFKFYGSKEGNDIHTLIDSKTVVEKKDFVSTGVLTYVMGDIIEVEISQFDVFKLGDSVKLTIYSKTGLFVFDTTVIAKADGSLIVLNPPENQRKFIEKRETPRVSVESRGLLNVAGVSSNTNKLSFEEPIHFLLDNISMIGLGFTLADEIEINLQSRMEVELHLGFSMPCVIQIVRKVKHPAGVYYGAKYVELPKDKTTALRAFILKNQVETYFLKKHEDTHKDAVEQNNSLADA
jgi:c-di-GMP-binding flagellar brake protein YcgR